MLRIANRAVGPAIATTWVHLLLEQTPQKQFTKELSRYTTLAEASPFLRRTYHRLQSNRKIPSLSADFAMSFTALYNTMTTTNFITDNNEDVTFSSIAKSTASHEEAMLLEEPLSTSSSSNSDHSSLPSSGDHQDAVPDSAEGWGSLKKTILVEGIQLPGSTTLLCASSGNEVNLFRNGHGVRSVSVAFGYNLNVYVASLYTKQPIRTKQDVERFLLSGDNNNSLNDNNDTETDGFVMEFTFLRAVTATQVSIAWTYQLDTSVSDNDYESYDKDRAKFLELLNSPIDEGGVIRFEFLPDDRMVITNQGQQVGEIHGPGFQRAFASMWFGCRPVMEEIKAGLLQGGA